MTQNQRIGGSSPPRFTTVTSRKACISAIKRLECFEFFQDL